MVTNPCAGAQENGLGKTDSIDSTENDYSPIPEKQPGNVEDIIANDENFREIPIDYAAIRNLTEEMAKLNELSRQLYVMLNTDIPKRRHKWSFLDTVVHGILGGTIHAITVILLEKIFLH